MKLHPAMLDIQGSGDATDWQGLGSWPWSWQFDMAPDLTAVAHPMNTGASALTQVLYLQETGDTSLISVNDINQGQIGDCFLLSSIGEIALWHPSAITNMI